MTMNESTNVQDTLTAIAYPLYNGIAAYTVESACWGAYFLLFTCATFLLWWVMNREAKIFTILWVLNFLYALLRVQGTLINAGPTLTLAEKVERTQNMYLNPLALPMEGLWLLNMLLNDCIVIWRAYIICGKQRLVIILPGICLLAALGFSITDMLCLSANTFDKQTTIPDGSRICVWSEPIAWALSLITNLLSTSAVALKAWELRRLLQVAFGNCTSSRSKAQQVLSLLVESGFIYCLFWSCEIILFLDITERDKSIFVYEVFSGLGDQMSGLYSTSIIVLVSLQMSVADTALQTVIVNGSALNSLEAGRALEVPARAEDNVVAQGISKVEQGMANEEDRKV
ncbi:hypothetical protein D9758_015045 [Tetrapyrgos nigripes]|uniref:Uncharacterized protein n=1 Tax=Tetrapyrgos nigripes TaxID=182062 RepID=A0A8H5CUT5_9AGAR|nr:hypothetical protein D9758_015045 [Tetrapyrgos nigripes]